MNLKVIGKFFKETAWMIDPFYKFLVLVVYIGGPITALFVLVLTYTSPHPLSWISLIILVTLVIGFKFGPLTFFIVNCSWIYFRFHKFGVWLPLTAYLIGLVVVGLQSAAKKILTPDSK